MELCANNGGVDANAGQRAAYDGVRVAQVVQRISLRRQSALAIPDDAVHVALGGGGLVRGARVILERSVCPLVSRWVDVALARVTNLIERLLGSRLVGEGLGQSVPGCGFPAERVGDLLIVLLVGRLIGCANVALKLLVELAALDHVGHLGVLAQRLDRLAQPGHESAVALFVRV